MVAKLDLLVLYSSVLDDDERVRRITLPANLGRMLDGLHASAVTVRAVRVSSPPDPHSRVAERLPVLKTNAWDDDEGSGFLQPDYLSPLVFEGLVPHFETKDVDRHLASLPAGHALPSLELNLTQIGRLTAEDAVSLDNEYLGHINAGAAFASTEVKLSAQATEKLHDRVDGETDKEWVMVSPDEDDDASSSNASTDEHVRQANLTLDDDFGRDEESEHSVEHETAQGAVGSELADE